MNAITLLYIMFILATLEDLYTNEFLYGKLLPCGTRVCLLALFKANLRFFLYNWLLLFQF